MTHDRYGIRRLYRTRSEYVHYDDSTSTDGWQLEVYLHALGLLIKHDLRSIIDVGCGSGFKLVTYFRQFDTLGIELPANVERLRTLYPDSRWQESDFRSGAEFSADCAICADVIEHVVNPDEVMQFLSALRVKYLILSTPARNVLYKRWWRTGYWGPPRNPAHQREWSFKEFRHYIGRHLPILDHRVTNLAQATQMIICAGVDYPFQLDADMVHTAK
jgi:Methyltransferase domain